MCFAGEYAFAFITGRTVLQIGATDMRLITVYVPTNHVSTVHMLLRSFVRRTVVVRPHSTVTCRLHCMHYKQ